MMNHTNTSRNARKPGISLQVLTAALLVFTAALVMPATSSSVHADTKYLPTGGFPSSGCPDGFALLNVAVLTAEGYHAPQIVDTAPPGNNSSWGSAGGNNDGWVCGRPKGNQTTSFGGPLYLFLDNQLPAATRAS